MRRRLSQRSQLVRSRTRAKNETPRGADPPAQGPSAGQRRLRRHGAARGWPSWSCPMTSATPSTRACDTSTSSTPRSRVVDRAIAARALRSPDTLRLMTVPGVSMITASTFIAAIGDITQVPLGSAPSRLPRLGPKGPPVWLHSCTSWTDHQARLSPSAPRPRRGRLGRRPPAWPAARLLRTRSRAPRRSGRRCRDRAQDRPPVLVPAGPPAELRLRPAVADRARRSGRSSSPPAQLRARARSAPATAPALPRSAKPNTR